MDRRTFVRTLTLGTVPASAGCFGGSTTSGTPSATPDDSVGFRYPFFPPTYYFTRAERVTEPERTSHEFADLPDPARLEFANAVHREQYRSGRAPALLDDDLDQPFVAYRGATFDVSVGVADAFRKAEHGPDADPNWVDPVEVTASVTSEELSLAITNELDVDLAYHHLGRPYFGIVAAVSDEVTVLDHERYEANEFVTTNDFVRTEDVQRDERTAEMLSPGESLQETYRVPDDRPGAATVLLPLWLGDESIDAFGNEQTLVNVRLSVEF